MTDYQQGDVIISRIKEIPEGAKKLDTLVLREGETTGHAHKVTRGNATLYEQDGTLYLRVLTPAEVQHEEHHPQIIPPGDYKIPITREYDHFSEEAREVID